MDFFTLKDSNIKKTGHSIECLIDNAMRISSKKAKRLIVLLGLMVCFFDSQANGITVPGPFTIEEVQQDTIPIKDRYGDFISDETYNPFDLLPNNISQTVEYDPASDSYVVYERIGDEYYRTPTTLTFEQYLEWKSRKQQKGLL